MCKPLKIDGQKDFKKPVILSKSYKHFVEEFEQGNPCQFGIRVFHAEDLRCESL